MNKLICEFGKRSRSANAPATRTLVLGNKKYEIDHEVAKYIIHNTDIRVVYKGKEQK